MGAPEHADAKARYTGIIVDRPKVEPGFGLVRQACASRSLRHSAPSYAARRPEGEGY